MIRILAGLAACGLCACASGPQRIAGASPEAMPKIVARPLGLVFAGMDTNGDGVTSRVELSAATPVLFAKGDTDGSGSMRPIELEAFTVTYLGTRDTALGTGSFDSNADGAVDEAEFSAFLRRAFEEADTSGDGALQRAEFIDTVLPGVLGGGRIGSADQPGRSANII